MRNLAIFLDVFGPLALKCAATSRRKLLNLLRLFEFEVICYVLKLIFEIADYF